MSSSSLLQSVRITDAPAPLRLRFGFPRAYLTSMLQRRIAGLLCLGDEACAVFERYNASNDSNGCDDDDDGPDFVLRIEHAVLQRTARVHEIDINVGILFGHYLLTVHGHRFEIAFLPTLDEAALTAAARWIISHLEGSAHMR